MPQLGDTKQVCGGYTLVYVKCLICGELMWTTKTNAKRASCQDCWREGYYPTATPGRGTPHSTQPLSQMRYHGS